MTQHRPRIRTLAMVALLISAAFAASAPMTAAQSDDPGEGTVIDLLFSDEDEDGDTGGLSAIISYASGKAAKYNPLSEQPEQADAEKYVQDTAETFNQHNETLMNWTNSRVAADADADVLRLKLSDESGNSAWLFIVTDVTVGNYTTARAMTLTEFKQTDREVDLTYRLTPYASRNANAELETFVDEYAEPDENVTQEYLSEMFGEYQGEISGDDLPGSDK